MWFMVVCGMMRGVAVVWSLFSGIGGLDEGLRRAGWAHGLLCESDAYRRSVLAARFPGVRVVDDVRGVAVDGAAGGVGLVAGGFPCQDLSVAGQRSGLGGGRSSLFFEFARVVRVVRPRWVLVENVPGLFSSCGCAGCRRCRVVLRWHSRRGCGGVGGGSQLDIFGDEQEVEGVACAGCRKAREILERHAGTDFAVVRAVLRELGYGVAFRVFDSQFFGVPQRRRRVFIVGAAAGGDLGAAAERAGEVLAVGAGCSRHPVAGGKAGEGVAFASEDGVVGSRVSGPLGRITGGHKQDLDGNGAYVTAVPDVAYALADNSGRRTGSGRDAQDTFVASYTPELAATLTSSGNARSKPTRQKEDDVNVVAYSLVPERGQGADLRALEVDTSPGLDSRNENAHDRGVRIVESAPADGGPQFVSENQRAEVLETPYARQLTGGGGKPGQGYPAVRVDATVRRLTPTECERLQGLPDGWTDLGGTPDSRRYAAVGDAVTVQVAEWIGRRLLAADERLLAGR